MNEIEKAIQEFMDNAFHESLKPDISVEAKALAIVALKEKLEREKTEPLTLEQLQQIGENPVWIKKLSPNVDLIDSGWAMVDGPTVLTLRDGVPVSWSCNVWWHGNEVEDNPSVPDYGKTWLAYSRNPKERDSE